MISLLKRFSHLLLFNFFGLQVVIFQNPLHMVVSQLICYDRVCSKYEDFLFRGSIRVSKLLKQGYSSRKLFGNSMDGRHTDLFTN